MRTVVKEMLGWMKGTSGVPLGSILALVKFLNVYISDMMEAVSSLGSLFTDDPMIIRKMGTEEDC